MQSNDRRWQMTLGQLIAALESRPQDQTVRFDFCGFRPVSVDSYRGYYEQLAITYTDGGGRSSIVGGGVLPNTVAGLLVLLREANGKTYEGYKGGSYRMSLDTPVWVANYGECWGTAVVGVSGGDITTIIETASTDLD